MEAVFLLVLLEQLLNFGSGSEGLRRKLFSGRFSTHASEVAKQVFVLRCCLQLKKKYKYDSAYYKSNDMQQLPRYCIPPSQLGMEAQSLHCFAVTQHESCNGLHIREQIKGMTQNRAS